MTLPGPAEWPVESAPTGVDPDLLRQRATDTPNRTAIVDADAGGRFTYGELDDRVGRRAARFGGKTLGDGRVGLLLDTGVGFAESVLAAWRRGQTVVPFSRRLNDDRLADQAARADLSVLVCDDEASERGAAVTPDDVPIESLAGTELDGRRLPVTEKTAPSNSDGAEIDDDRLVMFTSGTTGRPKGVRLTARNLVASANASAARLGVEPGDRWLVCLPMYHMGGLAPLVRSTLYGTTTVVQREFDPEETARVIDEHGISGVSLVPTMLGRLLDVGWSPPRHFRFVLLGGGPAPESLVRRSLERAVPVYPTYGTTETASQIATATPGEVAERPGTVGRPLRDTEVKVVSDDGDPVPTGETGELVVDGPTVTPGYLDGDATAKAFGEYGLETGDIGWADEAGRLWIVGRVDDAIVTGGETVHPSRVIGALRDVDGVRDAAVVGLPDEEWGERVTALVVLGDAESGSADETRRSEELRDAVRDRLPDYAVPKTVAVADDLPRTPSGTVDRESVRERVRGPDA